MQLNKITIFTVCFTILSSFHSVVWGQTISGKVIDNEQQPIVGATIILQSIDSTYISASVSDSNGEFILNKEPESDETNNRQGKECRNHSTSTE